MFCRLPGIVFIASGSSSLLPGMVARCLTPCCLRRASKNIPWAKQLGLGRVVQNRTEHKLWQKRRKRTPIHEPVWTRVGEIIVPLMVHHRNSLVDTACISPNDLRPHLAGVPSQHVNHGGTEIEGRWPARATPVSLLWDSYRGPLIRALAIS